MKLWRRFWLFWAVATLALWLSQPVKAQIVTLPIPGAPGLTVTVGTGANALPLQNIQNNPNAVNITSWDDGWTNVPLPWTFTMYGQNFTNSWAATNGFVTFQDPAISGLGGGCCSGIDLTKTTDPAYNYTIFGLHTDLFSWNGANQYYLNQGNSMTYGWYNISKCCDSTGGHSFEIKIDRFGLIDTRVAGAIVGWNPVTSGMSGDLSQGQYFQHYHGPGVNIVPGSADIYSWQALSGTTDMCTINPLSDPKCPGYASAYLTQQCTINPLYDPACPGYQQALLTQQCAINPLYSPVCPGYQQALYTQQCSLNPLYDSGCPGYQQAYFTQQCTANPLYDRLCPGYNTAYALQQQTQSQTMTAATSTSTTTVSITGTVSTTEPTVTISTTGTVTTGIALVPDAEVNTVITRQIPNESSPTGTVTVQVQTKPTEETEEERRRRLRAATAQEVELALKEEKKREEEASERRKQLAERQRRAAQESALAQGRRAIREADQARTMDQQTANQAYIVATMNFVPGFEAYGTARLPDAAGYQPYEIYRGQNNVDNRRLQRGLSGAQEQRHADMVDGQYAR